MTFRFGNDETLEPRTLAFLPVLELQETMEYCVCMWCLGERRSCCRRNFEETIDLGRGHLFFEKLGVRAVVTSEESPHLLLPLTSFGPQGHKIPAEIQPRIGSDECAVHRATCDSSEKNKIHSWIASTSDHRAPETDSTYTESLHRTDGQEKNPCDEARDHWENREGRWVRVHGIARRTLFDPMHDEQPFCQNLTERRRTTVRFLGQQSEMTSDDAWPQAGEMRSLWEGTTEFWTNDMPPDDTWEANRHHSHILPLFRSHLTRDTAAMFPSPQNTVTSTEHECPDPHLSAVPHTENAEDEGGCVVLGMPKLYSVYSTDHDDSSGATESQQQDPSEGMSSPVAQTPGEWYGKGQYVPAVWSHHQRQGRNHGNQQVHTAEIGVQRGETTFQPEGGGTHGTGSGARRGRRSQEVAGRGPFGSTSSPEQTEAAFRVGQAMENMSQITNLLGANLEPAGQ